MAHRTAIVNALLIDGKGGPPQPGACVLVEGETIANVWAAGEADIPADAVRIDATGLALLPAFLDGHMHVSREPGRLDHLGHVRANVAAVGKLQACLQWGTGTVGHAAGSPESVVLSELIREGAVGGCSDLLVGAAVTATCGHVAGRSADGPWEIRKAVREMVAAGADWIKTCATGGFQHAHEGLGNEDYTLEELRALVEQAHARGKRVHAHAHAQPGLGNAVEAGCDVILHGAMIDEAALEGIAEKGMWYMPTLHVTSEQFYGRPGLPAHMSERMKQANPFHRAGVAKAREMGVRIAVGTDGGPGSAMNEMRELVGCGFTPMEAIVAATRDTADALGVLAKVGTVEPGKQADLVAVKGDPAKDIGVLSSQDAVALVVKRGKIVRNAAVGSASGESGGP